MTEFLISFSWALFIMALIWVMLKPTWASVLVLVVTLGLAVMSVM